jgi:hypothetical protein
VSIESLPFVNGYPGPGTADAIYDELDYQRAVQAYIWAVPLVNGVALQRAIVANGVSMSEPSLLVFDHVLTPKQIVMTANSEVVYGFCAVDLAVTGPIVIDAPDGLFGVVIDLWNRGVVDIGIGPSQGKRIVLIPPGTVTEHPDEAYVVTPRTNRVFPIVRGIVPPGQSLESTVEVLSTMRVTRLADRDDATTRIIRNGTKPFDSDWPKDVGYFDLLADGLSNAAVEEADKVMYAMLGPLGIGPAATGPTDERARRILERAAATGAAMVSTLAFASRLPAPRPWPAQRWESINHTSSGEFESDVKIEIDERAQGWYQMVGNGLFPFTLPPAPPELTAAVAGTGTTTPGAGSWYAETYTDAAGDFLDGARSYQLHLATDPPVEQFWSATVYSNRTRSMIDTPQGHAGLSTYSNVTRNDDGSTDLHFGPIPPPGLEGNWIQTIPGEGFFVMLRLYAPEREALDGTWQLDDIEPTD